MAAPTKAYDFENGPDKVIDADQVNENFDRIYSYLSDGVDVPDRLLIDTAQLVNEAVTGAKIAAGAVGSTQLADGAVTTGKIPDDAITAAKLAPGAVGSTEVGDGTITIAKMAAFPRARVYRNNNYDLANAQIPFDTEHYDPNNFWTGGAPTRLTVPAGMGGLYVISGRARQRQLSPTPGQMGLVLRVNANTTQRATSPSIPENVETTLQIVTIMPLSAGDYVELGNDGTGRIIGGSIHNELALTWVGP